MQIDFSSPEYKSISLLQIQIDFSSPNANRFLLSKYTCEECVEGLNWVQMYMEDPIMIAEFTIYLEQNYCIDEWEYCKEGVVEYFPPMHAMAMEKFFIPTEICNQQEVCGATRPPFV